ncbi:MAG: hypothetical protein HKN03_11115 [Acidimicrobiales bacterium]|nr:hypothetical protein [Acidimicrobiales bacterium]
MHRRIIKTAKVRLVDAQVGDIVNRNPDAEKGWFQVFEVKTLFNGDLQLADETSYVTITGGDNDLIGVQFAQLIETG